MEYKFANEHANYADLASGHVFYSLPGHPAFPVRLASEIYQRCLALRGTGNLSLYDLRSMLRGSLSSQRDRLLALGFDLPCHMLGY